jgi:hypothetical protein
MPNDTALAPVSRAGKARRCLIVFTTATTATTVSVAGR